MSTKEIVAAYDRIEDEDPDISTERLLQMVVDECGLEDCTEVTEALITEGRASA